MKNTDFLNIGLGSYVNKNKVVCILSPDGNAAKRLKEYAKKNHLLYDATAGRKTRAIIVTEANQVILSAIQVETLINRSDE
ncbi:MAG: DUF370 domain-containing protein [Spirochaetes bacterium]|nr:DUF370 domain-containing protein [Spirochaetota bacterium]